MCHKNKINKNTILMVQYGYAYLESPISSLSGL